MFIVLGASGNVGSVVLETLKATKQQIVAVTHSREKATALGGENVEVAVVDVKDTEALRDVFRRGRRAFLLNPPGDPSGDSDAAELTTGRSITDALKGSGLEKIVVHSTYGARPGDAIGDLSTLYQFEEWARESGIPMAVNRAAYYFTNLAMLVEGAKEGIVTTAFPADFMLPMVAPQDLGHSGAERLMSGLDDVGLVDIEGPKRYTFNDVAEAFAKKFGHPVKVETMPRETWEESFRSVGFSPEAAASFARMTAATLDGADHFPKAPRRGRVTLEEFVAALPTD